MIHNGISVITLIGLLALSMNLLADGSGSPSGIPQGTLITIGIEESESEWPPYEYYERLNGKKTEKLTGFTVELTANILKKQGLAVKVVSHPWKRLLKQLEVGDPVQLIYPTSLNAERREKYLVSDEVYSITPAYFYLKDRFPDGVRLKDPGELLSHKPICGRLGYNYVNFGLSNDQVIMGSYDYNHLLNLLHHSRCKVILARYEVLAAYALFGTPYITEKVGYSPVPGMDKEPFHYLISKQYEYGSELLALLNSELQQMKSNGLLKALMDQYINRYSE